MNKFTKPLITLMILAVVLMFTGCDEGETKKYGHVVVISDPLGAQISMGGADQEQTTPHSFELETGTYEFTVSMYGYITPDPITVVVEENVTDTVSFELDEVTEFAIVNISSMPSGAEIYFGDTDTGLKTPGSVNIPPGTHTIRLQMPGFHDKVNDITVAAGDTVDFDMGELIPRRMILLEEYTNVYCTPCGVVAPVVQEVLEDYEDDVIFIEFHPNIAVVQLDIFYQMNPEEHNSRAAGFYSIGSLPHVYADGQRITTPDDGASVRAALNSALGVNTDLAIWGNWHHNGDGTGTAEVITLASNAINAQLYGIVAREHIEFDTPPGSNGLTEFHNVMYDCFPEPTGTPVNFAMGTVDTMTFDFELADSLVDEAKVFVFVQNLDKVVFQAGELEAE